MGYPQLWRLVTLGRADAGWFPLAQYDWYVPSSLRPVLEVFIRRLTFRDHRLMHWLSKVRARSSRECFSVIDLVTYSATCVGEKQRVRYHDQDCRPERRHTVYDG